MTGVWGWAGGGLDETDGRASLLVSLLQIIYTLMTTWTACSAKQQGLLRLLYEMRFISKKLVMQRWAYMHLNTLFGHPHCCTVPWPAKRSAMACKTAEHMAACTTDRLNRNFLLRIKLFYETNRHSFVLGLFSYVLPAANAVCHQKSCWWMPMFRRNFYFPRRDGVNRLRMLSSFMEFGHSGR